MITKHITAKTVDLKTIRVDAAIRYVLNEDWKQVDAAPVDGIPVVYGLNTDSWPYRWEVEIDVETGEIKQWMQDNPFKLRMEANECCEHFFIDENANVISALLYEQFVPHFLNGYLENEELPNLPAIPGELIRLDIDEKGRIIGWADLAKDMFSHAICDVDEKLIEYAYFHQV